MKKIISSIAMITLCSLLSAGNGPGNSVNTIQEQEFTQKCVKEIQHVNKTSLSEPMINCSIKVSGGLGGDSFTGTVTFHDVSIFHCAVIKLVNMLR